MSKDVAMNRWWVVPGAVLVQLCFGAVYSWSVYTPYLKGVLFDNVTIFSFTATQTQVIFSLNTFVSVFGMIIGGRLQDIFGPKRITALGGILFGVGYILAGFYGQSFLGQLLCIGIVGAMGVGFGYVCPIAVGVKWFPDKRGLITGISVAGFGFGALIWIKLGGEWGGLIELIGVLNVFKLYGILFIVLIVIGSRVLKNPPPDYLPPVQLGESNSEVIYESRNFTTKEMWQTREFYILWVMFCFSTASGQMIISNIKLFGIDSLKKGGYEVVAASGIAGTAMAVFYSLANGAGRVIWGTLSDLIGRRRSLFFVTFFQGVMMLLLIRLGSHHTTLYLAAALIGFNYGANFALFPAATADYFGTKNIGGNYGMLLSALGIAGLIGPILGGGVFDLTGSYLWAFVPAAVLCFIAAFLSMALGHPSSLRKK